MDEEKTIPEITKAYLEDAYNVRFLSTTQIGAEIGIGCDVVQRRMVKYGIPRRTRGQGRALSAGSNPCGVISIDSNSALSNNAIEFIEGELLGDGSIYKPKSNATNARYQHSSKYGDYLLWLSGQMKIFGIGDSGSIHHCISGSYGSVHSYHTRVHSGLTNLYNRWYPNGKKCIPLDLNLTPVKVRQWYIGDGYLSKRDGSIIICTDGFEIQEVEFLCQLVNEYIGIASRPAQHDTRLYIPRKYVGDFLRYVGQCPVEIRNIYGYKWGNISLHTGVGE